MNKPKRAGVKILILLLMPILLRVSVLWQNPLRFKGVSFSSGKVNRIVIEPDSRELILREGEWYWLDGEEANREERGEFLLRLPLTINRYLGRTGALSPRGDSISLSYYYDENRLYRLDIFENEPGPGSRTGLIGAWKGKYYQLPLEGGDWIFKAGQSHPVVDDPLISSLLDRDSLVGYSLSTEREGEEASFYRYRLSREGDQWRLDYKGLMGAPLLPEEGEVALLIDRLFALRGVPAEEEFAGPVRFTLSLDDDEGNRFVWDGGNMEGERVLVRYRNGSLLYWVNRDDLARVVPPLNRLVGDF